METLISESEKEMIQMRIIVNHLRKIMPKKDPFHHFVSESLMNISQHFANLTSMVSYDSFSVTMNNGFIILNGVLLGVIILDNQRLL